MSRKILVLALAITMLGCCMAEDDGAEYNTTRFDLGEYHFGFDTKTSYDVTGPYCGFEIFPIEGQQNEPGVGYNASKCMMEIKRQGSTELSASVTVYDFGGQLNNKQVDYLSLLRKSVHFNGAMYDEFHWNLWHSDIAVWGWGYFNKSNTTVYGAWAPIRCTSGCSGMMVKIVCVNDRNLFDGLLGTFSIL